jgi:hypothetical protein
MAVAGRLLPALPSDVVVAMGLRSARDSDRRAVLMPAACCWGCSIRHHH